MGVSKVRLLEDSGASDNSEAWLLLWDGGVSVHRVRRDAKQTLKMDLSALSHHGKPPRSERDEPHPKERWSRFAFLQKRTRRKTSSPWSSDTGRWGRLVLGRSLHRTAVDQVTRVAVSSGRRRVSLHFDEHESCGRWYRLLQGALATLDAGESPVRSNPTLYPSIDLKETDSVPLAVQRCIQHVKSYGPDPPFLLPAVFVFDGRLHVLVFHLAR